MKPRMIAASILLGLGLTACSSVINEHQTQVVNFAVVDRATLSLIPASCTVTSDIGNFFDLTSNPAAIEVAKGQSKLMVNCKKQGYYQKELAVPTVINGRWDYTKLTRITGFVVNTVTGNATLFPSNIVVLMDKETPYNTPALNNNAYIETTKSDPFFQGRTGDYEGAL